jgi:ADP-ribosylglycohydrolase
VNLPADHSQRIARARRSLEGLSVGDAFGRTFYLPRPVASVLVRQRVVPRARWVFTDATAMALSVVDVLADHGTIERDELAERFATRFRQEPRRGYSATTGAVLENIAAGEHWARAAARAFGGGGSMGSGAAMRAAPIGGYFAGDLARAASAAAAAAEITHAHPEAKAGASAIAVAAAWVAGRVGGPKDFFDAVIESTPAGETRHALARAATLTPSAHVDLAVALLGNGSRVTPQDTVPFVLWCTARHLGDFEDGIWTAVSGLGSRHGTCAMVGGILALHRAAEIPPGWLRSREPLGDRARREATTYGCEGYG